MLSQDEDTRTLIWVYAKGISVKIDNKLELRVANSENKKSFPLEKALRGLAKAPNTFVMGLFDCKPSSEPVSDTMTAKNAVLLKNNGGKQMNCMIVSGTQTNTCLIDDYFNKLKSMAGADGSVLLPHALQQGAHIADSEQFIKVQKNIKMYHSTYRPANPA